MTAAVPNNFGFARNPVRGVRKTVLARRHELSLPPGPKGRLMTGVLREFRSDPFEYLRGCVAEYGDVVHVPLPIHDLVVVNTPDLVKYIMGDPTRYSMVGPYAPIATRIIGGTIPLLEGDQLRERRKLMTPMFKHSSLNVLADEIVDEFATRIDRWGRWADSGQIVDLQHEIAWLTMPAFMRAMFGFVPSDAEIGQLDHDLRMLLSSFAAAIFLSPPPKFMPLPGRDTLPRAWRRITTWIETRVAHRRANPIEGTDMLQVLIDARDEDGKPLSHRDLVAELAIMITGGYETVVASVSWTLALLHRSPDDLDRLIAEVDALGGNRPTYADLKRLTWAKACFDEGQRLQGHPFHPRIALQDDVIGGHSIPKGTLVGVSVYALHRNERWWPHPDTFDPTRFTDREVIAQRPVNAFIPFGSGPHRCIGSQLGYMNAQFILALFHQRYRMHTDPGWTPKHASTFSTTIEGGLPVRLERVSADSSATQRFGR
ncbi:cytochrome P450 [Nocardia sp. CA-128927]|uniref:cytochrome P450 n=1 Tax=Nocardia sp. CA-128927 TaxID=3239975 RepID=UPI003D9958F6